MSQTPDARRYEQILDLDAPVETVWKAISEADQIASWFAAQAEVQPGVGGSLRWSWDKARIYWTHAIEIWEPERRLRTRYDSPVADGAGKKQPLFVDFQLEGQGGKTTLRLVHSGFGPGAEFDQEYDGISHGWPVELQSLRLYVERHADKPRQLTWSLEHTDLPLEELWSRLTSEGGFRSEQELNRLAPGDAFRIEDPDGNVFEGTALQCHAFEFSGRASSHGDAFLRIGAENCGGTHQAWLWLGRYTGDAGDAQKLQASWDAMLENLLGARKSPTEAARG